MKRVRSASRTGGSDATRNVLAREVFFVPVNVASAAIAVVIAASATSVKAKGLIPPMKMRRIGPWAYRRY